MIESSLAFDAQSQKPDAGYGNWRASVAKTVQRQSSMRYNSNDRTAGPLPCFGNMLDKSSFFGTEAGHSYAPDMKNSLANDKPDITYKTANPDDGFNFGDVIDIVNPLQHLPVIGTLYRKFTGDTMKGFSEIIGGAIFGGPVGVVSSTVNVIVKDRTGKDMAENVMSLANIDVSPKKSSAELTYLPVVADQNLAGTTLAVANLSLARDGRQNFAARVPSSSTQFWNT